VRRHRRGGFGAAGAGASFQTELTRGRYLLLCTMTEDEGRHYELGMIYRFEIEERFAPGVTARR
jgi:hypothetical protein